MSSSSLVVSDVVKAFGSKRVLNEISLVAEPGEFLVLVGPSGCGKSTMLRCIAGLESVSSGQIKVGEREITALDPKDRNIAMVFQDYALYPHKSVYENIAFGLRVRRMQASEIDRRVQEAASKLELEELLERKPAALSGGQRQRVAIGRAIVRQPDVFLFDEPLSNLDAKLRGSMRITIAKLHHELKTTVVYVTHDQVEAMTLADRIVVLDGGQIQQMGSPLDLYYHPANTFVAQFIGSPSMNLVAGKLQSDGDVTSFVSDKGLKFGFSNEFVKQNLSTVSPGKEVLWGLRADNLQIPGTQIQGSEKDARGVSQSNNQYKARVVVTEPLGPTTSLVCEIEGHEIHVVVPEPHRPTPGDLIDLAHLSKHTYVFDKMTGKTLETQAPGVR